MKDLYSCELEQCGNGGTKKAQAKAAATRTLNASGLTREMIDLVPNYVARSAMKARGIPKELIDIEMKRKSDDAFAFEASRKGLSQKMIKTVLGN